MSEQRLTVAELLDRASKEKGTTPTRSRRRRRSLDEGGISVAELTGSIPRVQHTPEQPKHSSHPIDTGRETGEDLPEDSHSTTPTELPTTEQTRSEHSSTPAEPVASAAPAAPAAKPTLDDHDTVVLEVVHEGDPVRLTTGAFPAVTREQQNQGAQPEAAHTSSSSSVDDASHRDDHPEDYRDEYDEAYAREYDREKGYHQPEWDLAEPSEANNSPIPSPATSLAEQQDDTDEVDELDDDSDELAIDEDDEPRGMSVMAIVGMVIVGLVLGFAIFKGFELLWGNFSRTVTSIVAVAVTAAMVGVAHALRTHRDVMTMIIVAVVGLVLTFGPSLIVGI